MAKPSRRISHEQRIFLETLVAGLPAVFIALVLLWTGDFTPKVQWTLTLIIAGFWLGYGLTVREHVTRPLQTMANLLTALRERVDLVEAHLVDTGPAIGAHAGRGTLVASFQPTPDKMPL